MSRLADVLSKHFIRWEGGHFECDCGEWHALTPGEHTDHLAAVILELVASDEAWEVVVRQAWDGVLGPTPRIIHPDDFRDGIDAALSALADWLGGDAWTQ